MRLTTPYPSHQFAMWRVAIGVFLAIEFGWLAAHGGELFLALGTPVSHRGTVWGPAFIFRYAQSQTGVSVLLAVLSGVALLVAAGAGRRFGAAVLCCAWSMLLIQNPLGNDPSVPFVGLMLLALVVVPSGEPWSVDSLLWKSTGDSPWFMPSPLYWGLWLLLCAGLSISGFEKLRSPLWRSGDALQYMLRSPVALDTALTHVLLALPPLLVKGLTGFVVLGQLLALPALLHWLTRLVFWVATSGSFFAALCVLDLRDVLVGMLLFYLFLFDARWLKDAKKLRISMARRLWKSPVAKLD